MRTVSCMAVLISTRYNAFATLAEDDAPALREEVIVMDPTGATRVGYVHGLYVKNDVQVSVQVKFARETPVVRS